MKPDMRHLINIVNNKDMITERVNMLTESTLSDFKFQTNHISPGYKRLQLATSLYNERTLKIKDASNDNDARRQIAYKQLKQLANIIAAYSAFDKVAGPDGIIVEPYAPNFGKAGNLIKSVTFNAYKRSIADLESMFGPIDWYIMAFSINWNSGRRDYGLGYAAAIEGKTQDGEIVQFDFDPGESYGSGSRWYRTTAEINGKRLKGRRSISAKINLT